MQRGYRRKARSAEQLEHIRLRVLARSILQPDRRIVERLAKLPFSKVFDHVLGEFGLVDLDDYADVERLTARAIGYRTRHHDAKSRAERERLEDTLRTTLKNLSDILNQHPHHPISAPEFVDRMMFLLRAVDHAKKRSAK